MDDRASRRAFREFVRAHHPDRGGDPAVFAAAVTAYRRRCGRPLSDDDPRLRTELVFRRTRSGPLGLIDELARRRAIRRRPPRVR